MSCEEAIDKLRACFGVMIEREPERTCFDVQHIIMAFHNMHGGKPAVYALCEAFGVHCKQAADICGTCATAGMSAAMDALSEAAEGNAPTSRMYQ